MSVVCEVLISQLKAHFVQIAIVIALSKHVRIICLEVGYIRIDIPCQSQAEILVVSLQSLCERRIFVVLYTYASVITRCYGGNMDGQRVSRCAIRYSTGDGFIFYLYPS